MCTVNEWLTKPVKWEEKELNLLINNYSATSKKLITINHLISKSNSFPIKFPIESIKCKTLLNSVPKEILERNIQSTYPIIHESVLNLCAKFLLFKLEFGTKIEKKLYQNMSILEFIQRLLDKRAVVFVGTSDYYLLKSGENGAGNWNIIGTKDEKKPLKLKNCLSYDELKISAFLSVSSYSYFINNGERRNNGIPEENRDLIQPEGIIIGLIGPRLVKPRVMEFSDLVITNLQNIGSHGYGNNLAPTIPSFFANFYQEPSHLYDNLRYGPFKSVQGFRELQNGFIFDNTTYIKRLAVSFDTLLFEANYRAQQIGKYAYIHVIGIGLGVWRLADHQSDLFVDAFGIRLKALKMKLNNISDVHFSYFPPTVNCLKVEDGDMYKIDGHPKGGIKIFYTKRNPYDKLNDTDKLLIVSYAWDSNACPGNEFWENCISNSSDSATASSCQVAELHNPYINETVCANNLMVVSCDGVLPIKDYIQRVQNK